VLGVSSLVLGALCYAAAFAFVERHEGQNRNFYFYSTAGGVLTLIGSGAILEPTPLSLAWCLLAVASSGLGQRFGRMTLRFHGALYAWASVVEAGLAGDSWRDLFGGASGEWPLPTLAGAIAILAVFSVYLILATDRAREARWPERLPQAITAAAVVWILGGVLVAGLASAAGPLSPAAVATLRTGVLAFSVLGLGAAARRWALPELAWFVYPLLTIGALKLVAEDLPRGRPLTLFLSLVLYGGALIAAPRLLRREP
jgi:hypothetical protein